VSKPLDRLGQIEEAIQCGLFEDSQEAGNSETARFCRGSGGLVVQQDEIGFQAIGDADRRSFTNVKAIEVPLRIRDTFAQPE
jgi:hypothetical protein